MVYSSCGPSGWPTSYGLDGVGQPVNLLVLYSNQATEKMIGMTGSWVATIFSMPTMSLSCVAVLLVLANCDRRACAWGLWNRSKSPVAFLPMGAVMLSSRNWSYMKYGVGPTVL